MALEQPPKLSYPELEREMEALYRWGPRPARHLRPATTRPLRTSTARPRTARRPPRRRRRRDGLQQDLAYWRQRKLSMADLEATWQGPAQPSDVRKVLLVYRQQLIEPFSGEADPYQCSAVCHTQVGGAGQRACSAAARWGCGPPTHAAANPWRKLEAVAGAPRLLRTSPAASARQPPDACARTHAHFYHPRRRARR